jgi:hypothetical protein
MDDLLSDGEVSALLSELDVGMSGGAPNPPARLRLLQKLESSWTSKVGR